VKVKAGFREGTRFFIGVGEEKRRRARGRERIGKKEERKKTATAVFLGLKGLVGKEEWKIMWR
jgi:hypothetical protein